jgi:hypothetical protein
MGHAMCHGAVHRQMGAVFFWGQFFAKCFAMATDPLDHVQALHSPPEVPSSRDSFVARWRITPAPLG